MKLPKKAKVAGFDFNIMKWHPLLAASNRSFGEFSNLEMAIRIDASVDKVKVVDTLMHEINHAIYWAYGMEDEDKEERIVGTFASAWTQVFRDNPKILKFITQELK